MANANNPKPSLGTLIHGTLREEDLIAAFIEELQRLNPKQAAAERAAYPNIYAFLDGCLETEDDSSPFPGDCEPGDVAECLESLEDELNALALPFTYFGAHPGDGADYGFWPDIDSLEEAARFKDGVLKIEAGSAWPSIAELEAQEIEYVCEVTDHGNCVLFYASTRLEVWSCV